MEPDTHKYNPTFAEEVKGLVVGEKNTIYNYFYYSQEAKSTPPDSAKDSDEILPCPYRGLFHFGPDDAEFFFGREVFVTELLQATQNRNFIPVLGASGSGKSSVVLAGLVPQLQQKGNWKFTHFRPGNDPFHALALALVPLYTPEIDATDRIAQARKLADYFRGGTLPLSDIFSQIKQHHPNDRVLLIADQFEELYTLCSDEKIRRSFLDILLASFPAPNSQLSSAVLVTTMRADFLGNALSYRPFADLLQNADIKLGAMNREELSQVIEKPADKLGVRFADGLVERILDSVENEPGNLPLLEFALTELWAKCQAKELTHAAYEDIGEVQGALTTYANAQYQLLNPSDKKQVQRIFVQLVRPGEGAEDTRRMALKAELGEQSWSLVKQLADARLVVTSQNSASIDTVEVVHEALIKNWGQLREWMSADRDFRSWQERLRAAVQQWQEAQQDEGALLRGVPLVVAESWLQKRSDELSSGERDFIQNSVILRERQKQQEKRLRQRIILGLSAGFIGALSLAGFAGWQWRQAEITKSDVMAGSAKILFSQGKELDALRESLRAKLLVQRLKAEPSIELLGTLQQVVSEVRERNRLETHSSSVMSVSFSSDRKTLASGSDDTIKLWDITTGKEIRTLQGHSSSVTSVSFSSDGKTLASGSVDNTIKLWDITTGKEIRTLQGHSSSVTSVSFSSDGKTLASGSFDNTIKLWDITTGKEIRTLQGQSILVTSVSFSSDGKTLASGSDDTIKLWDITTGKEIRTLQGHSSSVTSVSFSSDGKTLASGSVDNTIKLWDITTGKEIRTLQGHSSSVTSVSFSFDRKTLASGSDDTIKLWDITTGKEIRTLQGHSDLVNSVSFSRDGKTLASGSVDKTIKLWDITTGKEIRTLQGHSSSVTSVSFSSDRKTLASGSVDKTIKLWDITTGKEIRTLQGHSDWVNSVSFSPDGKTLASGSDDKTIKLWDITTGKEIRTLQGHSEKVNSVSFSFDRKTLASGSDDKTIKLWDITTGKEIRTLQGHSSWVMSVSFSPDRKTLASGSVDKTIKLWDITTGKEIRTLQGHSSSVTSVSFSPDRKTLASGSVDNTIKLWDITTGKEIRTLQGHSSSVMSVSFSSDGKTLASGSDDKTIKLWDITTGKEIRTLQGHSSLVSSVSFSPDGKTLASGSGDNTVILWDVNFEDLLVRGCDKVRVYLHNPSAHVRESDRHLCDGIGTGKSQK